MNENEKAIITIAKAKMAKRFDTPEGHSTSFPSTSITPRRPHQAAEHLSGTWEYMRKQSAVRIEMDLLI
jgi:hypothetical protein